MTNEAPVGELIVYPPARQLQELGDTPELGYVSQVQVKPFARVVDGYVRMRPLTAVPQDRQLLQWVVYGEGRMVRLHMPLWWQLRRKLLLWFDRRAGRAMRVLTGKFDVSHPTRHGIAMVKIVGSLQVGQRLIRFDSGKAFKGE